MDGVVSPETAVLVHKLGGLGVLNLEGIWTRFENAEEKLEEISRVSKDKATALMQEIYETPVKSELIAQRVAEIKAEGAVVCGSFTPQSVQQNYEAALEAGLDILVIQGTVISAEHVSTTVEPLNLKEFIAEVPVPTVVGGCASYSTGLHLMRTGAVCLHHPRRARHRRAPGDGDRRRGGRPLAAHAGDRRVRQRDR
jgi:IMP dehydrogenase